METVKEVALRLAVGLSVTSPVVVAFFIWGVDVFIYLFLAFFMLVLATFVLGLVFILGDYIVMTYRRKYG